MPFSSFILHPSSSSRKGFTLTELMISVAIALLLLVGINQVFKTTSQTVGTSYAALESVRKQVALNNVFDRDFEAAANVGNENQPAIVIHSESRPDQFWDPTESSSDKDGSVFTDDLDDDSLYTSVGENITVADLRSGRNHRIDSFSFFARDVNVPYRRQTADQKNLPSDPDQLVADESSTEAWIWYGFLRLPRNPTNPANPILNPVAAPTGDFFTPGQGTAQTNQNNFYARDWALGRQAILLKSTPAKDYIKASGGLAPPLSPNSQANVNNPDTSSPWLMAHSRFDIAIGTIKTLQAQSWTSTNLAKNKSPDFGLNYSFTHKPWTEPKNDPAAELASGVPFLSRGINQFIVEFAGDFVTQDVNGAVTAATPDGVLDYVQLTVNPFLRKLRWYGFPRDIAGPVTANNPTGGPDGIIQPLVDVVPVRDIAGAAQPFEQFQVNDSPSVWGPSADYIAVGNTPAFPVGTEYICAWGPNDLKTNAASSSAGPTSASTLTPVKGPWLIRIVLTARDTNNRLPDGTTIEHVYSLNR